MNQVLNECRRVNVLMRFSHNLLKGTSLNQGQRYVWEVGSEDRMDFGQVTWGWMVQFFERFVEFDLSAKLPKLLSVKFCLNLFVHSGQGTGDNLNKSIAFFNIHVCCNIEMCFYVIALLLHMAFLAEFARHRAWLFAFHLWLFAFHLWDIHLV